MAIYVILFSIIYFLIKNRFKCDFFCKIKNISIKKSWLLILCVVFRFSSTLYFIYGIPNILSLMFLVLFIYFNMDVCDGIHFVLIGLYMNFIVISFNSGKMPVSIEYMSKIGVGETVKKLIQGELPFHKVMDSATLFPYFADVIPVANPFFVKSIISLGDCFIYVGLFFVIKFFMTKND